MERSIQLYEVIQDARKGKQTPRPPTTFEVMVVGMEVLCGLGIDFAMVSATQPSRAEGELSRTVSSVEQGGTRWKRGGGRLESGHAGLTEMDYQYSNEVVSGPNRHPLF